MNYSLKQIIDLARCGKKSRKTRIARACVCLFLNRFGLTQSEISQYLQTTQPTVCRCLSEADVYSHDLFFDCIDELLRLNEQELRACVVKQMFKGLHYE